MQQNDGLADDKVTGTNITIGISTELFPFVLDPGLAVVIQVNPDLGWSNHFQ